VEGTCQVLPGIGEISRVSVFLSDAQAGELPRRKHNAGLTHNPGMPPAIG
jgi:hypothetical protein